jgi:hypothetical protein
VLPRARARDAPSPPRKSPPDSSHARRTPGPPSLLARLARRLC